MFSEPDDPVHRERMRAAFAKATALFDCASCGMAEAWGHAGRTIGAVVTTASGSAWLRVLEAKAGQGRGKLWTGTEQAAAVLPRDIPRPRLLGTTDWRKDGYAYRAELSTYITEPVCSSTPDLTGHIALPDNWWSQLREATDAITSTPIPSDRPPVITPEYIGRTIPRYVEGVSLDTTVHRWTLAHGDLHWANLTGPGLTILDWEGFGPAPHGFDAAHLHAYTLAVPVLAARVREVFADVLATPEGRLAELTVAAILLQAAERDAVHARLAPLIRTNAQNVLRGRPSP